MSNRIKHIKDSPCWDCPVKNKCSQKRMRNRSFDPIVDMVWGKADYDRKDCPLYIAINAPEMMEED